MVGKALGKGNPARADARRQQVLDAAGQCFRRAGFRGASMSDISAMAGMSTGHIYHYFKNKEAIVEAIVERNKDSVLSDIEQLKRQPDVLQALIEGASQCMVRRPQDDLDDPALLLEIFAESSRNPVVAALLRQRDAILRESFQEALAIGQQQGSIVREADLNSLIDLLAAIFDGLIIRNALHPDTDRDGMLRLFRLLLERFLRPA